MKTFKLKKAVFSLFILFSLSFVFAQTEINQFVIPKRIFVGDTAELNFMFRSNVDFFKDEADIDEKTLDLTKFPYSTDTDSFTIKKAIIKRNGPMYTVVLTFIPWKPGLLDFGQIDLLGAIYGTKPTVPFNIDPSPVEIASILPKGEDTVLRSVVPPLLAPGTIYVIYGCIVLIILLIVLGIMLFAKRHQIALNYKKHRTLRNYARNARKALKQIRKLEKNQEKLQDDSFCFAIQQIFRVYLTERFGINFLPLATSQLIQAVNQSTGDFFSDAKLEQLEILHSIFIRSDYIRFAHQGTLHKGERGELISKSNTVIQVLESSEGENHA